jgi:gluconate kinase
MNVVWDQTSTTRISRKRKFDMLQGYCMIAVVFPTPEPDELARRLASRPGRRIPWEIVSSMINNFEMPSVQEGFDEIRIIS